MVIDVAEEVGIKSASIQPVDPFAEDSQVENAVQLPICFERKWSVGWDTVGVDVPQNTFTFFKYHGEAVEDSFLNLINTVENAV